MRLALGFLFIFLSVPSEAKTLLTITCGEPVGSAYGQEAGQIAQHPDRSSGARPVFIIDSDRPKTLIIYWRGHQASAFPEKAEYAPITSASVDKISAVHTENEDSEMYSLFARKNLMFMTSHSYVKEKGGIPVSSSLYASCDFVYTEK